MNLFVLSGHGSESFAAFLNGVILQKTTRQLSLQQSPLSICAVVTAAVITAALFFVISLHLRMRQRTHFHAPTIQTNSFYFGSNIYIYIFALGFVMLIDLKVSPFYVISKNVIFYMKGGTHIRFITYFLMFLCKLFF